MTRFLVIGAFAVWIGCGMIRFVASPPLGHDEAQYALAARDRVEHQPRRWIYASAGMEVVGAPGVLAGGSDRALRVLPMLLGLGLLVAAWRLAVVLGGADAAAWAVAVLAGTTPLSRFQIDLLSDLPAAACLVAALAILIGELRRAGGPRWRVVAIAPLCAAALYLRYGSCIPLAIIGVATLAFGGLRRQLVVAAAAFALVVRPSLVHALLVSSTVPPSGGGLATYVAHPVAYLGVLGTVLAVLALAGAWRDRWLLYATLIAVADVVALGLETRAHSRYIALAIVLLVAVGAAVARELGARLAAPVRRALAAGCAVAVAASWSFAIRAAWVARDHREAGMAATLAAAEAITRDARGRPCTVIGRHTTQLEWYSGCRAAFEPAGRTYVVRDDTGGPDQPALVPGVSLLHAVNVDVIRASSPASAD